MLLLPTTCLACGNAAHVSYHTQRTITTLTGRYHLHLVVRRCVSSTCTRFYQLYRPEAEGAWALPHGEYGLDVLAEYRLREQLEATGQTIPNQVNKPTARPTMRWVFQCFEGIELLHIRTGATTQSLVLRLQPLHHKILSLLGPASQQFSFFSD